MKCLRSDRGTEYENALMKELCELMGTEQKFSTAYHHQSVGSIERNHRFFNEYIRSFVFDMSSWDVYLRYFTFLYNITKSSCFNEQFSPYELIFARKSNCMEFLNDEIQPLYNVENYVKEIKYRLQTSHKRAKQFLDALKIRNKKNYDKNVNPINLSIGQNVMLKKQPYDKHSSVYSGPYIVTSIDDKNVTIKDVNGPKEQKVHKNRIIKI